MLPVSPKPGPVESRELGLLPNANSEETQERDSQELDRNAAFCLPCARSFFDVSRDQLGWPPIRSLENPTHVR